MSYPEYIIIFSAIFTSIVLSFSSIEVVYWLYKWTTDKYYDGFYFKTLTDYLKINNFIDLSLATLCFFMVSFLMGLVWPLSIILVLIGGGAFGTRYWLRLNKEKELR